jgi:hypothetical protein
MLFLADENTPESICEYLEVRGHEVRRARDVIPSVSDEHLAAYGNLHSAVLITWNVKHFRRIAARRAAGSTRFRSLGRLCFNCPEVRGLERLQKFIETLEQEYAQVQRLPDKRLMIEIGVDVLRICR